MTDRNWQSDITGGPGDPVRTDYEGTASEATSQGGFNHEVGDGMPPPPRDPNAPEQRAKLRNLATGGVDTGHAPGQPGEPDIEERTDLRAGPGGIDAPHEPGYPGDAAYPGERDLPGMAVPEHSGHGDDASGDIIGGA